MFDEASTIAFDFESETFRYWTCATLACCLILARCYLIQLPVDITAALSGAGPYNWRLTLAMRRISKV
jgi:hypothetical protein